MPFFKAIKSNSFVGFKKKRNLDLDFLNVFTGTMDNVWLWGSSRTSDPNSAHTTSSPSQTAYYASHKFSKIYNQWDTANSMGIKADGTLWGWGENSQGQLGLSDTTARTSPVQVGARTDWLKVAPGGNGYTHMLRTDGVLFGTGYNLTWTMIGDGTNTGRSSPVQVGTGFSDVTNGYSWVCACKSDGTLWSWGQGLSGQLGDGVTYNWSGNFNDGTGSRNAPYQIGSGGFNKVFADGNFGGAAKSDGYLYGWAGGFGRFGNTVGAITAYGTGWSNCEFFATSSYGNQLAWPIIKSDGTLWMYGNNTYGQLGQGDTTSYSSPKQVGTNTNWFSATTLTSSIFATTTDRKMFSWGRNSGTQILALGDTNDRSSPTQIGTRRRWGNLAGMVSSAGYANGGFVYVLAADT
jgi:alpha-tubulin suppressor-like RCC1 family protein